MGSITFTGSEYLSGSATVTSPGANGATLTFWMRSDVTSGTYETPAEIYSSSSNVLMLTQGDGDATTSGLHVNTYSGANGPTIADTSTWYFVAVCWDPDNNDRVIVRYRAESSGSLTTNLGGQSYTDIATMSNIVIGDDQSGAGYGAFDGGVTCVKLWNRLLTEQEALDESDQYFPVSTTSIVGFWPLDTSGDYDADTYGNNLSATGTPGYSSDAPDIPYTSSNDASGTLQAGTSTVSGASTRSALASGSLQSAVSTVLGDAIKAAIASGSLQSSTSTVSGAATKAAVASGNLAAANATVSGDAQLGAEPANAWFNNLWWKSPFWGNSWWGEAVIDRSASGDLSAEASTVSGAAVRSALSTGTVQADVSTTAAETVRTVIAEGTIQAESATTSGVAFTDEPVADGSLSSEASTVSGESVRSANAEGALDSDIATTSGEGIKVSVASGDPQSDVATTSGEAGLVGVKTASGTLEAQEAEISGSATISSSRIILDGNPWRLENEKRKRAKLQKKERTDEEEKLLHMSQARQEDEEIIYLMVAGL